MFDEIHALDENHTWYLVDLPQGKKVIRCKWVLAVKVHTNFSVEKLKDRLGAKIYA